MLLILFFYHFLPNNNQKTLIGLNRKQYMEIVSIDSLGSSDHGHHKSKFLFQVKTFIAFYIG